MGAFSGNVDNATGVDPVLAPQVVLSPSSQGYHSTGPWFEGLFSPLEQTISHGYDAVGEAESLFTNHLPLGLEPRTAWYSAPASGENPDFQYVFLDLHSQHKLIVPWRFTNQEEWNLFMTGVDEMLSGGAANYVTQQF